MNKNKEENNAYSKKYEYGLKGLAKILGCSLRQANRIKKEGVFSEAIHQKGNLIIIDRDKIFELLKK